MLVICNEIDIREIYGDTFLTFNLIGSPAGTFTLIVRVLTSSDILADLWPVCCERWY